MTAFHRQAARCLLVSGLAFVLLALAPQRAPAAAAPAWQLRLIPMATNFPPGSQGSPNFGPRYNILATNVGGGPAPGPITVTDTLPAGLTPTKASSECSAVGQTVTCSFPGPIGAGGSIRDTGFGVKVDPLADPTTVVNEATIESPGTIPITASATTTVTSELAPFGLIEGPAGLSARLIEEDGSPATLAGSHPDQLTVDLGVNTKPGTNNEFSTTVLASGGGLRDVRSYLPHGLIVNPSATEVRCTEAQFETATCPDASAVGRGGTMLSFSGAPFTTDDPLFNMVPPPGSPASFGFNPLNTGVFVHLLGGIRPGDYGLAATSSDIPNLFNHVLYAAELTIWGDPTSPSHNLRRGRCGGGYSGFPDGTLCPVPRQKVAALSMPTSCPDSMSLQVEVDSWEASGDFLSRSAPFTDLEGSPTAVTGCNALAFDPSLSIQPTTDLTDSPTGLNVDLALPQSEDVEGRVSAHLKDATVTLPDGLVVNPSSANGLASCSPSQVGIDPDTGVADGDQPQCPDASKLGTVEVATPLLGQYDSKNRLEYDSQGHVIPDPIPGAVYLATPHDNPFDSLLALYLVFADPDRGVLVKLAGKVEADPRTGRLTTTFAGNPQVPFANLRLHFFGGAKAALRTPLTCGTRTATSTLTPWSAPEGVDASPSDSFEISAAPGGGLCPQSDVAAANNPAFNGGTVSPQAGAYSPFVLKLSREDGSQPISQIDTTLPPGLTGKLAGIAYCPEAALLGAAGKSGIAERQSSSCPASSEVGTVVVGAGAGPTPYYTEGKAYLAGPYKGAPISLAIITPATAGPFDLGTVVVRTALNVEPETARIHAVSDPIPQILQGIPLDIRSIALRLERPDFTLNPTSCDPMTLDVAALSPFGSSAPLSSRFQVGGCQDLPFKPKLALSLTGGTRRGTHPSLKAVLTARPGEANIASAVVGLPHSEFLDQSHIRTICTRVQFAASACPPGSVYGTATALTPLLDEPLSGPVYLRSSSHALPDLVADLNGQIHIVLAGRVDSKRGGIRNSFEAVPDAPVTSFTLSMQGGKKGLLVNSRNICRDPARATVQMYGQNGKAYDTRPALKVRCRKGGRGK